MRVFCRVSMAVMALCLYCSSPLSAEFTGFAPLEQAVIEGSIEKVEQLLIEGADVNHDVNSFTETHSGGARKHHTTPLYWAMTQNDTDMVSLLLQYGADDKKVFCSNFYNHLIWDPASVVLRRLFCSEEIAQLLVEKDASVANYLNHPWPELHRAILKKDFLLAQIIVEKYPFSVCERAPYLCVSDNVDIRVRESKWGKLRGVMPLDLAIQSGSYELVETIIKYGGKKVICETCDIIIHDNGEYLMYRRPLPLFVAMERQRWDIFQSLLSGGADPLFMLQPYFGFCLGEEDAECGNDRDWRDLDLSKVRVYPGTLCRPGDAFNIASHQDSKEAMRHLLAWCAGKDVKDVEDYEINTSARYSVGAGLNYFIGFPAEVAFAVGDSEVAAMMVGNTKEELLSIYLVRAICNYNQWPVLARHHRQQEWVHFLLEYGANHKDAFMLAVKEGKVGIVEDIYLHSEINLEQIDDAIDYLLNQPGCGGDLVNLLWTLKV